MADRDDRMQPYLPGDAIRHSRKTTSVRAENHDSAAYPFVRLSITIAQAIGT